MVTLVKTRGNVHIGKTGVHFKQTGSKTEVHFGVQAKTEVHFGSKTEVHLGFHCNQRCTVGSECWCLHSNLH